jgi:mono/diheme cytochrome c family protein
MEMVMPRATVSTLMVCTIVCTLGCPLPMSPPADTGDVVVGDASSGATLFANNCMVCHGADAMGLIGPNIQGADNSLITDHVLNAHEGHTTFEMSDQDIADLEAFLAGF